MTRSPPGMVLTWTAGLACGVSSSTCTAMVLALVLMLVLVLVLPGRLARHYPNG